MNTMTGRERWLLAAAVAAAVVFVYIVWLVMPLRSRADSVAREYEALNAGIGAAERMYEATRGMPEVLEKLRAQSVAQLFSDPDVPMAVMRQLDTLASDVGIVVASVVPEEPELIDGLTRYPTLFKIETDFPSLIRLLYEIERPEQRLWVEAVRINRGRGNAKLQAEIRAAAFAPAPEGEGPDAQD
jgi:hypothetical protein